MTLLEWLAEKVDNVTAAGGPLANYLEDQAAVERANDLARTYRDAVADGADPERVAAALWGKHAGQAALPAAEDSHDEEVDEEVDEDDDWAEDDAWDTNERLRDDDAADDSDDGEAA